MKNGNQRKALVIVICVIVAVCVLTVGCFAAVTMVRQYINKNSLKSWDIELPSKMSVEYKYNDQGWFGDGTSYTAYAVKEENEFISELVKDENAATRIELILFGELLDEQAADTPAEARPDSANTLYYLHEEKLDDNLYIVYDADEAKLYVLGIYF